MIKLTDTQSILLSTASQREGGSLYPLPTTLTAPKPVIAKSVAALITRGLAEERETDAPALVARTDGDLRDGVFITPAGLSAIGTGEGDPEPLPVVTPAPSLTTKSATVIALLQRATGATLPELIAATGWLPHTHAGGADRPAQEGPRGRAVEARRRNLLPHRERSVMATLAEQLAELPALSSKALRDRWMLVTAAPVPRVSPSMLRLALGYELQARALGGLSRSAQQRLAQLASAKTDTSPARPGMRLIREWNGVVHVVTIGEGGVVQWNEREWRSLSEVARAITGTRWSGPAFFGLKQKKAAA